MFSDESLETCDDESIVTNQPLSKKNSFKPFCEYLCVCDEIKNVQRPFINSGLDTTNRGERRNFGETKLVPLGKIGKRLIDMEESRNCSTMICPKCYLYKIHVPLSSQTDKYTIMESGVKSPFEGPCNRCSLYSHFCWKRLIIPASRDTCCYFLCLWAMICWLPRCI